MLWPAVIWFFGWRLSAGWDSPEFSKCVAFACHLTALALLTTQLFRQVCRKKGLAEAHFGWAEECVAPLRRNLRRLLPVAVPLTFLVTILEQQDNGSHTSSLGRLAFIAELGLLAVFCYRTLRPCYEYSKRLSQERRNWLSRSSGLWYRLGVASPLVLAGAGRLWLLLHGAATGLAAANDAVAHSRPVHRPVDAAALAPHCAPQPGRSESARAPHGALGPHHGRPTANADDHHPAADELPNLAVLDTQTRRLLRSIFLLVLTVGGGVIWADVLPAFKFLDEWKLWPATSAVTTPPASGGGANATESVGTPDDWITVGDLVMCVAIVLMTVVASRNLPGLLEIAWLQRLPLDAGGRYALTSLSRYVITLVGVVAACRSIGVGWANVQWLAAAMTVGLGFGLQEIFANFVSGLIILFERPMRVGDTVTVCGVTGTVSRIRSRATTITDADRKELIVPNKEFITGQLVNWTLTDTVSRVVVKVGVAYGTDVALATRLLLEAARAEPFVLRDPAPTATMIGFGASTLDLELHALVASLDKLSTVRHNLHVAIDEAYRQAGIEMAFPQQDI